MDTIVAMPIMLARVYDALVEAGASTESARAAAEELAGYEQRFAAIERDLFLVKWMLGVIIAGVAALVIKAYG
jgi:hypothetical protein